MIPGLLPEMIPGMQKAMNHSLRPGMIPGMNSLGYNFQQGNNVVSARAVDDSYNVGPIRMLEVTL